MKQESRTWYALLAIRLKNLGFEQCKAGVIGFRVIEDKRVAITAVVHVDKIFAVGRNDGSFVCGLEWKDTD